MQTVIWIGLAHVGFERTGAIITPQQDAFVQVLGLAVSRREFIGVVRRRLSADALMLHTLDEIDTLRDRRRFGTITDDLLALAADVGEQHPIAFGTFHVFEKDD